MKFKNVLIIFIFLLSFENGFSQLFLDSGDDPSKSKFPGGHVSIAVHFGKNSNGNSFWAYQISAGIALPPADASNISLFAGVCIGKRVFKNKDNYNYYDLQLSAFPLAGIGIGKAKIDGILYNRQKIWAGLGPLIYSRDWLKLPNESVANDGLMFSVPIIASYGNQFYP